ncbi:MAG: putative DNA-binding domain-containing protein [Pseudomonadota bacterium]
MPKPGSNLPDFRATQIDFAAHIRNPEENPAPAGLEARRLKIYLELFYNNIESFLANSFPIAKKVLGHDRWHALAREFVHRHGSESPYFLEISQEFLTFLSERENGQGDGLPGFLLELAHYEWVELALSVSEEELPVAGVDAEGDLLEGQVVVSPLIWCLAYRWPVHKIGPDHLPEEAPAASTELIVYRRADDSVAFMEVNPVTLRLVELLRDQSGREALDALALELPQLDSKVVYEQGLATLRSLRDAQILLGTWARAAGADANASETEVSETEVSEAKVPEAKVSETERSEQH